MIVYISDAGFHTQGDGFFNGMLRRHDEQCHLDAKNGTETEGDRFDYPSMAQTASVINDQNIMVALTFSLENDEAREKKQFMINSYNDFSEMLSNSKAKILWVIDYES